MAGMFCFAVVVVGVVLVFQLNCTYMDQKDLTREIIQIVFIYPLQFGQLTAHIFWPLGCFVFFFIFRKSYMHRILAVRGDGRSFRFQERS